MPAITRIKNNKNTPTLNIELSLNPLKNPPIPVLVPVPEVIEGNVMIVIKYKNPKTANNIVMTKVGPKYCLMYPPGSIV